MNLVRIRLLGQHIHFSVLALAILEAAVNVVATHLAAYIRFGSSISEEKLQQVAAPSLVFAAAMAVSLTAMGLYALQQRARTGGVAIRLVAAAFIASIAVAVASYVFPNMHFGRGLLAISAVLAVMGCFLVRVLFMHVLSDDMMKRRVLVYGTGRRASSIKQLRRRSDRRGFVVAAFVQAGEVECLIPPESVIDPTGRSLTDLVEQFNATEVVVALDEQRKAFPAEELLKCRMQGVNVIDIVTFLERETGKVRVDMLSPSWLIFSGGFRRDVFRENLERIFDICAAGVLLALAWPLMLLACLAIKLEDGWRQPVLYKQVRVGLQGRCFTLLKFRSMRVDAEKDGRAAWAAVDDPRVTRVGSFIRKTRIDELPQLLNVLRGDMSFVGPRPERPEFVAQLAQKIPYYHERHWVKPGITGWAQLCYPYGASERDAKEKLQYDLYYVKHRNVLFDLFILLETAEIIFWRRGAR